MITKAIKLSNHGIINNYFVRVMLWLILLFSTTGFKHIWGVEKLSIIINSLILVVLIIFAGLTVLRQKHSRTCWSWIIFPSLMVIFGFIANLLAYGIWSGEFIQPIAYATPAIAMISAISIQNKKIVVTHELWRDFYRFMLFINIISLIEYYCIFEGYFVPRSIVTPYGEFLAGYFTLFYPIDANEIHYRYYACFLEPGTLAMYLIPAIVYSILNKKFGAFAIFILALYMTDSLGGYISLALVFILLPLFMGSHKNKIFISVIFSITIFVLIFSQLGAIFKVAYEERDNSRETRELAISNTFSSLPSFFIKNPLGYSSVSNTDELTKKSDYLGFTFTPAIYAQGGGFISFLGYLYIIVSHTTFSIFSIIRKNLSTEEKLVVITLLANFPFIFQRSTVYESSLYALLFLPSLIKLMNSPRYSYKSA
jgi:hypothetical protein